MTSVSVTELGCAGHFIGADRCLWRRHTQVGTRYRVSSVGMWVPAAEPMESPARFEPLTIWPARMGRPLFETMVFRTAPQPTALEGESCGCGCHDVLDHVELTCVRYATAGEARAGHEEMVARFVARHANDEEVRDDEG